MAIDGLADDAVPDPRAVPVPAPMPGPPPAEGAQWDEVHRRWEVWDDAQGAWVVVGDSGTDVAPDEEPAIPPHLARLLVADAERHGDDADDGVIDLRRIPEPDEHVPGAQWNEVAGRWERWDDAADAWVPVPVES